MDSSCLGPASLLSHVKNWWHSLTRNIQLSVFTGFIPSEEGSLGIHWNDTGIFFPGRNKFCQTSKLYCVCIGEKSFEVYWTLWPDRCVFCAACRLQDNACASPVLVAGCAGSAKSSSGGIQRSNVMVRYHHHPNAGPESQTFEGQPVCQGVYKKELGELL